MAVIHNRLYEISTARKNLELEQDRRALLYKKYKRGEGGGDEVNVIDGTNTASMSASTGMGVAGVGILSTIVVIPMAIGLEIDAAV